jgi:hypothetical protein
MNIEAATPSTVAIAASSHSLGLRLVRGDILCPFTGSEMDVWGHARALIQPLLCAFPLWP